MVDLAKEADKELKELRAPINALTLQKALQKALKPILATLQEIHEAVFSESGELTEEDIEADVPKTVRRKGDEKD